MFVSFDDSINMPENNKIEFRNLKEKLSWYFSKQLILNEWSKINFVKDFKNFISKDFKMYIS